MKGTKSWRLAIQKSLSQKNKKTIGISYSNATKQALGPLSKVFLFVLPIGGSVTQKPGDLAPIAGQ